ncbi:MAG: class I SAM-dependent methyltransferase [Deltaproteobacteria bacterium]|nr:class I SAM-dependent methyltransferase [Deltaproteobacteria bacterium]
MDQGQACQASLIRNEPDAMVYIIERSHKKCIFLKHIIDTLEIQNIELIEADATTSAVGPFNAIMSTGIFSQNNP